MLLLALHKVTYLVTIFLLISVYVILKFGGQRPSSISQMPLQDFSRGIFYFAEEKRRRVEAGSKQDTTVYPFIQIDEDTVTLLLFYANVIRPLIINRLSNRAEFESEEQSRKAANKLNCFFIHTSTGKAVEPKSITKTLQYYGMEWNVLQKSNLNLNSMTEDAKKQLLTSAALRRSYATGQYQLFLSSRSSSQIGADAEEHFLRRLANSMNTSPYILKLTYIMDRRVLIGDIHEPLRLKNVSEIRSHELETDDSE